MPEQPLSNIKALSVMHFSLLMGQIMFAGIAAYLVYTKSLSVLVNSEEVIAIAGPGLTGLAVAFVLIGFYSYNSKLKKLSTNEMAIQEKLSRYRAANIIRWAILEAPTLLAIIAFLLTGKPFFILVIAVLLCLFIYTKPGTAKAAKELGINEVDVQ
jgi:hypothetical protein